jgi:hypothetical protein
MLRVFKPTSPLSVGSWILAPFSGLATAAALSELTGRLPALGRLAGFGSAVLGPPLATYTAVLLADTAVPAWHEAYRDLPFAFAGSATASGGAMGIITTAPLQGGAARRMVILGSFLEITAVTRIERALGLAGEPYQIGRPGFLLKTSRVLTAAGAVGSVLGRRSWRASAVSGALVTSGAVCARFGIFLAGVASAKDPKYTVVPQRERLRAREAAASSSAQFQPANPKENSDGVDGVGRNQ